MKIPFGLLPSGELVDVSEVERGLKCGCLCPGCRSPLVARQGEINIHHFAHYGAPACKEALEIAITQAILQILNETKQIRLPPLTFKVRLVRDARILSFEQAIHKPVLGHGITPTLGIKIKDKTLGIVLQYQRYSPTVCHVLARAKQPALLINLAAMVSSYKKQESGISLAMLQETMVATHTSKTWIYHSLLSGLIEEEQRAVEAWHQQQAHAAQRQREELGRQDMENAKRPRAKPSQSQGWPPLHETFIKVSIEQIGGLNLSFPTSLLIPMIINAFGPNNTQPPKPEVWLHPFAGTDRPQIRSLLQKIGVIRNQI